MSEDRRLLDALTAELTALGFLVFSASDFEELEDDAERAERPQLRQLPN